MEIKKNNVFSKELKEIKNNLKIPKYFQVIIFPEMESYYKDSNKNFFIKPMVKCPLHDEDTPSFRWYPETNTFYCFGCNEGGDIIDLHRKYFKVHRGEEISFINALAFLKELYEDEAIGKNKKEFHAFVEKPEIRLENRELIILGKYLKKLSYDISCKANNNYLIDLIDDLYLLVNKSLISFEEAKEIIEYIEKEVNQHTG